MDAVPNIILYLAACIIVAIVANKRGRSWLIFGGLSFFGAIPIIYIIRELDAGAMIGGVAIFISPLTCFVAALSVQTGRDLAISNGDFGDYKKCPFCAESVRKEAIKCKHCASDLAVATNP